MKTAIPWLLVCSRVVLAPIAIWLAFIDASALIWLVQFVFAALSDWLDGKLARRWGTATAALRQADSVADTVYTLAIAVSLWLYYPALIYAHAWGIGLVVALEALRYPLDFWRFGRGASYHAISAKLFGISLLIAVTFIMLTGHAGGLLWVSLGIGVVSELEGIALSLLLPVWAHDVKHIAQAIRIRRQWRAQRIAVGLAGVATIPGAETAIQSRRAFCQGVAFKPAVMAANYQLGQTLAAMVALTGVSIGLDRYLASPALMFCIATPLLALLIFRLFVIQHDCAHSSFYPGRAANRRLGEWLAVLTLTPFAAFAKSHLQHHGVSGKLDSPHARFNHTVWFTSEQYQTLPWWQRKMYRVLRAPPVFFILAPALNTLRTLVLMQGGWGVRLSALLTAWLLFGHTALFTSWLCAHYLFNLLTIFGVHIQHTFNPAYCRPGVAWTFEDAALSGSCHHSTFGLGWFFMGVEHHALHHFAPNLPGYRLAACHAKAPPAFWQPIKTLSAREAFACLNLTLFSVEHDRFEPFPAAHSAPARHADACPP